MKSANGIDVLAARRLEERALNASGAFQSLLYDGWLLGYRPGPTKRLRCVNPFYASTLPLAEKVAYCERFYAGAKLPPIFRLLPFSEPPSLDEWLEANGWRAFDRTRVLRVGLAEALNPAVPRLAVDLVEPPRWDTLVAKLLEIGPRALRHFVERAASYPLPHVGAVIRREGEAVACGLLKLEGAHAGLFAVHTAAAWRGRGLGRAVVASLLAEGQRRGAREAYLQVTEDNRPALAMYARFGFTTAYAYWYRARHEDRA